MQAWVWAWAVSAILVCAAPRAAPNREVESLYVRVDGGRQVHARVRSPHGAAEPMPAVILLGGFERGASVIDLVRPSRPTVVAAIDYPFQLPDPLGTCEALRALPSARQAIHDSLSAVGALHAELLARGNVDRARVSIVGVSFGAPFAVIGAAEHAIPGLVVLHGFADAPQIIGHQFERRWAADFSWGLRPLSWALGRALAAYAGLPSIEDHAAALREDQQVWMLSARDDALIPAAATESLRAALARSGARVTYTTESGGHLRGDRDPRIPHLLRRTEAWLIASGL